MSDDQRWREANPAEKQESIKQQIDEKTDWHGKCAECGEAISGTIQDLRSHTHGNARDSAPDVSDAGAAGA